MISDKKTPRQILETLTDTGKNDAIAPLGAFDIDKALLAIGEYYTEIMKTENVILSMVEIDKEWVKDLIIKSKLLDEAGAERIAEGISLYNPIKLIGEKT